MACGAAPRAGVEQAPAAGVQQASPERLVTPMPLIGIFRFFIALFSLALLALGLYLAWSWW